MKQQAAWAAKREVMMAANRGAEKVSREPPEMAAEEQEAAEAAAEAAETAEAAAEAAEAEATEAEGCNCASRSRGTQDTWSCTRSA